MNTQNNEQKQSFFASAIGKVTVWAISAVIIYGLIVLGLSSGGNAIFLCTLLFCGYFGWKALNRITPDIFLFMSIGGWAIYFLIKGFLSAVIGAFVAPFQIAKMISNAVAESAKDAE